MRGADVRCLEGRKGWYGGLEDLFSSSAFGGLRCCGGFHVGVSSSYSSLGDLSAATSSQT